MQSVFTSINGVTDLIMVSLPPHDFDGADVEAARTAVPRLADLGPQLLGYCPAAMLVLRRFQCVVCTLRVCIIRSCVCLQSRP
jgi:hypothetical protein